MAAFDYDPDARRPPRPGEVSMKPGSRLAALFFLAAATAAGQTVDEIVAKNLEARGGAARLKATRSARMSGTMTMGPGMEAGFVFEFLKPGRIRQEFTVQGLTGITAFDGKAGWQVMPFGGKADPEPLPAEDLKEIAEQAENLDGDLSDWREKGSRVELLGRETAEGTDAWKLRITLKTGTVKTVWLDAATYLEFRGISRRQIEGKDVEIVTTLRDYRDVSGLKVPFFLESRTTGQTTGQAVLFRTVEFDVPIDPARFRMPAARPAGALPPLR
jgi:hypothetical protein